MKPARQSIQPAKSEVTPNMEVLHISLLKTSPAVGGEACEK
jgi:hypothetical protein